MEGWLIAVLVICVFIFLAAAYIRWEKHQHIGPMGPTPVYADDYPYLNIEDDMIYNTDRYAD